MKKRKNKFTSLILAFMFCLFSAKYSQNGGLLYDGDAIFTSKYASEIFTEKKSEKKEGIPEKNANNIIEKDLLPGNVYVYPGGDLIGIKLDTKGVIAVDYEDLRKGSSYIPSPAGMADILPGDIITHINGLEVNSADEFERILSVIKDDACTVSIQREEVVLEKNVSAVVCDDGVKRIGLWVRDNVTGLGTLSFITQDKTTFAALGHPISDSTTGITVPVRTGELKGAEVMSIVKGKTNHPGEIRGIIRKTGNISGKVISNNDFGLYGRLNKAQITDTSQLLPVAMQNEIVKGKAHIITTVDNVKCIYEIEIEKITPQSFPSTRSMMIRITDKGLLEKTGGIIQGMSGSPIIQNGKLIGAVTHVLTADPTRGYAVFAEWMIKNCSSCQNMTAFCTAIL